MPVLEQRRAHTVTRLVAREVTTTEAALLLGLSERSIWRLKQRRSRWPKRRTGTVAPFTPTLPCSTSAWRSQIGTSVDEMLRSFRGVCQLLLNTVSRV